MLVTNASVGLSLSLVDHTAQSKMCSEAVFVLMLSSSCGLQNLQSIYLVWIQVGGCSLYNQPVKFGSRLRGADSTINQSNLDPGCWVQFQ